MTEKLVHIDDVSRLSRNLVRILGGNPGKFTLQGTNTYLITPSTPSSSASRSSCILIDTAEGKESYAPLLRRVLDGQDARAGSSRYDVSDIVLTHRHHDHVGGLPSVLKMLAERRRDTRDARPPRLHKFPDEETDEALHAQLKHLPHGSFHSNSTDAPIAALVDGSELCLEGDSAPSVRVVHTPGHTKDHICLLLYEEGALLTGDHVLGQGTSVFEDLGSYLSSLRRCIKVLDDAPALKSEGKVGPVLYPAHGPIIENGKDALNGYLSHRLDRENQVLDLLRKHRNEASGAQETPEWTIPELVSVLYSKYPETLYPAAARGLFLHLHKLGRPDGEAIERGVLGGNHRHQGRRVRCSGSEDGLAPDVPKSDAEWMRVMELKWALLEASPPAPSATGQGDDDSLGDPVVAPSRGSL